MSLDLTIYSPIPIKKSGTGVYVRDGGMNKELSLEEVKAWFPGRDLSDIQTSTYETDELWSGNITHNLGEMASHVNLECGKTLYDLLWRPDENGFNIVTKEYRNFIFEALEKLESSRDILESYNPSNGWGSYDALLNFTRSLCESLVKINLSTGDEYKIYVSR
jgi:hypothetical protein